MQAALRSTLGTWEYDQVSDEIIDIEKYNITPCSFSSWVLNSIKNIEMGTMKIRHSFHF